VTDLVINVTDLDTLISQAASRRLRIMNLFQLDDGRWQVNLRPWGADGKAQRFCTGSTAADALRLALNGMPTDEGIFG